MTHAAMSLSPRSQPGTRSAEEGPIVVATKPLENGEAPLAVARWLAHREDRELHIVSVMEHNDSMALAGGVPPLPAQFYEEERALTLTRLRSQIELNAGDLTNYRVDVLEGPSARSIVELAHDRGARVIVIGTGRHDSIGRFVYGERAMQILRLADRPVLVVPRVASAEAVRHALIAVDFSASSLRAATAALPMIQRGGRITLIHVRPAANPVDAHGGAQADLADRDCEESFRRFVRLLAPPPDLTIETKVVWGNPVNAIDEFARLWDVGLIASGRRRNHTLAERLFVGTVSSGLIRRSTCPVLVVPEEDDAEAERVAGALTGIESWDRDSWSLRLAAFEERNRDRRVRLAVEMGDAKHGGLVAQGYTLFAASYEETNGELSVMIQDSARKENFLSLHYGGISSVVLFTDLAGNDQRLRVESATGCVTLTVAPEELP